MRMQRFRRAKEQGATALIIVMFSALLFVTITVGFMKIMADEQARTNDNELSQGAYDSALAGVEDGKRVLAACADGNAVACATIDSPSKKCTTVIDAGFAVGSKNGNGTTDEVYLKTSATGNGTDFEQAYTCVKISRDTPNYKGNLPADSSSIVPLKVASGAAFDSFTLSWFAPDPSNLSQVPLLDAVPTVKLPQFDNWGGGTNSKPSLMRLQLMQFDRASFKQTDFDNGQDASTLYLYPSKVGANTTSFALDNRQTGTQQPISILCHANFTDLGGYACQARVALPSPLGGSASDRVAYLRLTSLYNSTDYQIQLFNNNVPVDFYDVQPSIDSTGRAADVFRRVDARVERADPNEALLFPRATVDITGNFCKSMTVSTSAVDYDTGTCTP